ncbi:hypothetical protein, partial [Acinetobacter baumannii]|uniref:hypothetical protein n=1 Tax=Acinetobacter baumannii TaxID=470 RepID=UPI00289E2503
ISEWCGRGGTINAPLTNVPALNWKRSSTRRDGLPKMSRRLEARELEEKQKHARDPLEHYRMAIKEHRVSDVKPAATER